MKHPYKHGLRYTRSYTSWVLMKQRCTNVKNTDYHRYGGRGIMICEQWINDPEQFCKDMGEREKGQVLDRMNNDMGYSPENCRWVNVTTSMRNTRISKWWFVDGVRYESLAAAALEIGVTINTIKRWCEGRSDGGRDYPAKLNCWSELKYE